MKRRFLLALFITTCLGVIVASVAFAQQPTPSDDEVNAIAKQLYCPVCENIPLDVCPTPACAQWRELIRQKLTEGASEQEIKDYFVQQYGARVLGTPPAKGFNWLVYIIPPLAILAGAYVLYHAFRAWNRPSGQSVVPPATPDEPTTGKDVTQDEYLKKMEEELRKR